MEVTQIKTHLSIKIFQMDYYFAKPISEIDQNYSDLRGAYASKLPIVRIFGTSPTGQKICANIHGVLPYFYVQCPPSCEGFNNDYIRQFCSELEQALCTAMKTTIRGELLVFSAALVSGRSIYGFSGKESLFIKIYVLDPSIFPQCADVLLNGMVMGRSFQPFETHIPFLLKFCIDYNLYGMNYLHTEYFKIRASLSEYSSNSENYVSEQQKTLHQDHIPSSINQLILPDVAPRLTSTDLEIDISAQDILNRVEHEGMSDSNPGLEALWLEEQFRRINHATHSASPSMPELPTPDELLPLTKQNVIPPSSNEMEWLAHWEQLKQRFKLDSLNDVLQTIDQPAHFVSDWLRSSQDGSEDDLNKTEVNTAQSTITSITVSTSQRTHSQSSGADSSVSGETRISLFSQQELMRLAQATEEADAPVFPLNQSLNLNWSLAKTEAVKKLPNQSASRYMCTESSSQIQSSIDASTKPSIVSSGQSKDLLTPQLNLALSLITAQETQDSHVSEHENNDDAEATLVSNATRAAISYMSRSLSQRDSGGGYTNSLVNFDCGDAEVDVLDVEADDDMTMSELVHSDEDILSTTSNWDHFHESFVEADCPSRDSITLGTQPSLGRLAPLGELDEHSDLSDESHRSDFDSQLVVPLRESSNPYHMASNWSPHPDCAISPQLLHAEDSQTTTGPEDEQSEILFTSWSSDTDDSGQTLCQIPQVDGPADDEQSDTTPIEAPSRTRRRRLGLRLRSRPTRLNKVSRMDDPTPLSSCHTKEQLSADQTASCSTGVFDGKHIQSLTTEVLYCGPTRSDTKYVGIISGCDQHKSRAQDLSMEVNCYKDSSLLDQIALNPTVILERLDDVLVNEQPVVTTSQHSLDSLLLQSVSRHSPAEEFEDLKPPDVDRHQLLERGDLDLSSFFQLSDNSQFQLGRLTLFSQTQCSPHPVSPLPVEPLQSGIWTQSLPQWRCSRVPPSFDSVSQWAQARDSLSPLGLPTPTPSALCDESKSEDAPEDEENILTDDHLSNQSGIPRSPSQSFNAENPTSDDTTRDTVSHERRSSIASMSMLYQSTSQRCFLPVQVDHTTIASLELHCRVRMISRRQPRLSSIDLKPSGSNRRPHNRSSQYGLLPDPSFDPVCLACLSLRRSSEPIDLFVLTNRSEFPGEGCLSDLAASNNAHINSKRCRIGFMTNWLTTDRDDFSLRPAKHTSSSSARPRLQPKWIWCSDEWDLYNWIVYLIQRFDPEILVGYDVERSSWGFLVERASVHLQRQSYARELSRLAPDILQCPHCSLLIKKSGCLVPASHINTEDVMQELSRSSACCSCPCRTRPGSTEHSLPRRQQGWPAGPGAGRTGGPFPCPGRVVLCLWRVLMSEISLFEYSLETVVRRLLKETVPRFSAAQLHQWLTDPSRSQRWRTVDYWLYRSVVNLRLISVLDLIGRTSEFARVFGIEFYHVLSRGSQYRVESLLGRTARSANFLLPSPSVSQRARQRAPEAIPLTLEPESRLFVDGPVAVLDFQSLYPSIIIAYNYCYSTVLGRLECLSRGEENLFELGCLFHSIPSGLLDDIDSNVTISPNGIVFVNSTIREGILPRMLKQLLRTRLMVKDSMKLHKSDKCLTRLLDARQLGLKLMANVIYGYTSASFSGRMPCVDVGDSIVHKARETLERAIHMVHTGSFPMPDGVQLPTPPRVVYGDTDSLFIHLPGLGQTEAFAVAAAIAQAVTDANPAPIKLKLEKIYYPCLLEAKKRYAGYSYESPTQTEPIFDSKGLETVRRDGCPFVSQMLEATLRMLFDQFSLPMSVFSENSPTSAVSDITHRENLLRMAESRVRDLIRMYAHRLLRGQIPFADCILTRPYWGQASYRPGAFAPALQVARRLIALDPRLEPSVGERVVYYLAPGRPNQTLISCVRTLAELSTPIAAARGRRALSPRLNLAYYLDKQLLPPLIRMAQLMEWRVDLWLQDLPRFHTIIENHRPVASGTSFIGLDNMDSPSSSYSQSSSLLSRQCISHVDASSDPPTGIRQRRRRASSIMRAFVRQPARHCASCNTVHSSANPVDPFGFCQRCVSCNPCLSMIGSIQFGIKLNRINEDLHRCELICTGCLGHRGSQCDAVWLCTNILCPVHSARLQATSCLASCYGVRTASLADMDPALSW